MSNTSAFVDDTLESNSVLNPTFHDVQIKLVQIVNPNTTTVKFKEHGCTERYHHNDTVISLPSDNTYQIADETLEQSNQLNHKLMTQPVVDKVQKNDRERAQSQQGGFAVPVVNVPLDPPSIVNDDGNRTITRNKSREDDTLHNEMMKQRHREEMLYKKQQLINSFACNRRRSGIKKQESPQQMSRYFEVAPGIIIAEQPPSRMNLNTSPDNNRQYDRPPYIDNYNNRAATVPNITKTRVWTGHRSASSRAVSSLSSRWKVEEPVLPKPNMFVKMPFKQVPFITMENKFKVQDELLLPGEELRATTAFAVSRIRHALKRMAQPNGADSRQGRLLKARLKPLEPVKVKGPHISSCRGVQPEFRKQGYSPSPSRQRHLKEQYIEACKVHKANPVEDEYERRMNAHSITPDQSIHRTSPQPEDDPDYQQDVYPVNLEQDLNFSDDNNDGYSADHYSKYARQSGCVNEKPSEPLEQALNTMKLESSVIY